MQAAVVGGAGAFVSGRLARAAGVLWATEGSRERRGARQKCRRQRARRRIACREREPACLRACSGARSWPAGTQQPACFMRKQQGTTARAAWFRLKFHGPFLPPSTPLGS